MDKIGPTSLDYAILGLVHQRPRSGYGIRKEFETTALGNYSSSPGAIYPALNRLQKLNLIIKGPIKGTKKDVFRCTQQGEDVLKEWFSKPLDLQDVAKKLDELLLRFGFMGELLDKEQALNFLKSLHHLLKEYIGELKAFHQGEHQNLPIHGRLAFEHGIASYKTTLSWCKKAILTLSRHEEP